MVEPMTAEPMTAERLAVLEDAVDRGGDLSAGQLRELLGELKRARQDADDQYMEADFWRESYRLAKDLSHNEIGAIIGVRDAFRVHPRPCNFPHKACRCDDGY